MDWSFTAHGDSHTGDVRQRNEAFEEAARVLKNAGIGLAYAGSVDSYSGSRSLYQASTGLDKLGEEEDIEAAAELPASP